MSTPRTAGPSAVLGRVLEWARRSPIGRNAERRRILYAYLATVALFAIGQGVRPGFASVQSIESILQIASFVGLVAAGQTFVILIGGIDLSVPYVLNGASVLVVVLSTGLQSRAAISILAALFMGLGVGIINGLAIAYLAVPAVVMTLGMNGVVQGLTIGLTGGFTCSACADSGPPVIQSAIAGRVFGIPSGLFVWAAVVVIVTIILSMTTFGRRIYAVGNNPMASRLAGVPVGLITVAVYGLCGLFAALAGVALLGVTGQTSLGLGDPYLFQSITAVVIGGVYILGGRGHYLGVVAGSISLVALISVLEAVDMPIYGQSILYGVVILVLLLAYGREEVEV
jgi:ribose transport system permease protein